MPEPISHAEMIAADIEWLRGEYEYHQRFCERYPKRQGAPTEPDEAERHRDRIGRLLAHLERTQPTEIAALTEQRDRAMKVVEVARAYRGGTLDDALAAFDAETAS